MEEPQSREAKTLRKKLNDILIMNPLLLALLLIGNTFLEEKNWWNPVGVGILVMAFLNIFYGFSVSKKSELWKRNHRNKFGQEKD